MKDIQIINNQIKSKKFDNSLIELLTNMKDTGYILKSSITKPNNNEKDIKLIKELTTILKNIDKTNEKTEEDLKYIDIKLNNLSKTTILPKNTNYEPIVIPQNRHSQRDFQSKLDLKKK